MSCRNWLKIIIVFSLFPLITGCSADVEQANEVIVVPMIVFENVLYTTGYDDSNLVSELPDGFQKIGEVQGVEEGTLLQPRNGYANEQANQIRGVEKGTTIYGNEEIPDYIMTKDNGQYVVYSSKKKEEVDYSDFLEDMDTQNQDQELSGTTQQEVMINTLTLQELEEKYSTQTQLLLHNQGRNIKNDFIGSEEEREQKTDVLLVAVSISQVQGILYETAYFSRKEMDYAQLLSYIDNAEDELLEITNVKVQKDDRVNRFYWELEDADNNDGSLAVQLVFHKKKETSKLQQKNGSSWTVQAGSYLQRKESNHIAAQTVRLEADYGRQAIVKVGQIQLDQNEEVTEDENNIDDLVISTYNTEQNGFVVEDKSSLVDKYGLWTFVRGLRGEEKLLANPAVKISRVEENLELNIQYEVEFLTGNLMFLSKKASYDTGKIKIAIPN